MRDEAATLAGKIAELRHSIHREPEIGLNLPETQAKVLDALAGLPLEISTGRALSSVTAVLRGPAHSRAHSRRPGPVVLLRGDMDALPVTEETGLPFASEVPGAMHACGHDLHTAMLVGAARLLSARQADLPGSVIFMFQPGEEGCTGARYMIDEGVLDAAAAPGRGVRPARDVEQAPVRDVRHPAGPDAGRRRPDHGHRARARRARLPAAPCRRPDPGRLRDGARAADAGDQEVRRLRSGRHHGRQLPRRHHRQRDPRPGPVPGHRTLLQRRVPDRAGGHGAAADQGHRQRARADGRRRIRDRVPGHRQRRGRGGVRRADDRRGVRAGPGRDGPFPITGAEDFSFVLEEVPGAFVFLGRARPAPTRRTRPPTTPRGRSSTTRRWPMAPPSTPNSPCAASPRVNHRTSENQARLRLPSRSRISL